VQGSQPYFVHTENLNQIREYKLRHIQHRIRPFGKTNHLLKEKFDFWSSYQVLTVNLLIAISTTFAFMGAWNTVAWAIDWNVAIGLN
jgi:hypothetical protein